MDKYISSITSYPENETQITDYKLRSKACTVGDGVRFGNAQAGTQSGYVFNSTHMGKSGTLVFGEYNSTPTGSVVIGNGYSESNRSNLAVFNSGLEVKGKRIGAGVTIAENVSIFGNGMVLPISHVMMNPGKSEVSTVTGTISGLYGNDFVLIKK